MEGLTNVLGKKIAALGEHIKQLKADNSVLAEQNAQLRIRVQELEKALEVDVERSATIDRERASVQAIIDELVENIDTLMVSENR